MTQTYPTVATTWLINFEQVESASKAAADLLRISSMLDPKEIPFELLTKAASELGDSLRDAVKSSDPLSVHEVLEPLARLSLVHVDVPNRTYSIHRLVQEVVKDTLSDESRREWGLRVVKAIKGAFPSVEVRNWPACERLVPHALAANSLIEEFGYQSEDAAHLLNDAGYYLYTRGQFGQAEPLLQRAMEIYRTLDGQRPEYAITLNNLALLYEAIGRYNDAEPLYHQAIEIDRECPGRAPPVFRC